MTRDMRKKKVVPRLVAMGGILIAMLVWTAPAHADVNADVIRFDNCKGEQVRRCVWINWDPGARQYRAHAHVKDRNGGIPFDDYDVAVTALEFCSFRGCSSYGDYDGWHPVEDGVQSTLGHCNSATNFSVTASAHFRWKRVASDPITPETLGVTAQVCW